MIKVNFEQFKAHYRDIYAFLYDHGDRVAGYHEAMLAFDDFAANNKGFIAEYVKATGDFIASDREAAAFMLALYDIVGEV